MLTKKSTYLQHGDKVDVISVDHLINELDQLFDESLVLFKPGSVKVETQRGPVGVEVTVKVVPQHRAKLFRSQDVGARGHQVTTRELLIKVGIITPVQLIDDHLPDRVAS